MPTAWLANHNATHNLSWDNVQWSQATSLALPPQALGAPSEAYGLMPLTIQPSTAGSWVGRRAQGSPVNCDDAQLCIHSGGTHTECVAHISDRPRTISEVAPLQLLRAVLLDLPPRVDVHGGVYVHASDLRHAWAKTLAMTPGLPPPNAVVIRSRAASETPHQVWSGTNPPYFQPEALTFLVEAGVQHLVTDLPSLDPESDGGLLLSHHAFFGEAPRVSGRDQTATITELAWIPASLTPGIGLLRLDVLAWDSDAAPSRPVYYPIIPNG